MNIYSAKFSQDIEFYVYEYLRTKKSKYGDIGSPYYVGKGKGNRAYSKDHSIKPPKDKTNIRISALMNEADSFQGEMLKIHQFGRIDFGTGCLRNRTDGGEGLSGNIRSKETRDKISIALMGKSKSTTHKINISVAKKNITEETKMKISKSKTGISNTKLLGQSKAKETIAKIVATRKANGSYNCPRDINGKFIKD